MNMKYLSAAFTWYNQYGFDYNYLNENDSTTIRILKIASETNTINKNMFEQLFTYLKRIESIITTH